MAVQVSQQQAPAARPASTTGAEAPSPSAAPAPTTAPVTSSTSGNADDTVRRRNGYVGAAPTVQVGGVAPPEGRELDTKGIPIVRRRGTVAAVHVRVKGRQRPPRPMAPEAPSSPADEPARAPAASPASAPRRETAPAARQAPANAVPKATRAHDAPPPQPSKPASPTPGVAAATSPGGLSGTLVQSASTARSPHGRPTAPTGIRASHSPEFEPSDDLIEEIGALRDEWRQAQLTSMPERRCVTCRSYRASETPGRGWCVNPHAFPTQQLVEGDDLACLTFIGNWWVRSDDFWLSRAGTEARPTPLTDGLIEILRERQRRKRPS